MRFSPDRRASRGLVEDERRDPDYHEHGDEDDDGVPDEAPGSPCSPEKPSAGPACLVPEQWYDLTVAVPVPVPGVTVLEAPAGVMAAVAVVTAGRVATPEVVPAE
jgi:hypothetical protein